jgi:hypothetical protein
MADKGRGLYHRGLGDATARHFFNTSGIGCVFTL